MRKSAQKESHKRGDKTGAYKKQTK